MASRATGQLIVKLVEAHSLKQRGKAQSPCRPYCVIEYERTEVVSRTVEGEEPVWDETFYFDTCRQDGELRVSVFDRNAPVECDMFGTLKLRPTRTPGKVADNWFKLLPVEWKDRTKGEIRLIISYEDNKKGLSIDDFDLLRVLGKGSFGKVMQVRKKDSGRIYAMKILKKESIVARSEVEHTKAERHVLAQVNNPFLVSLKFCFQTPEKVY
eukprot:Opistho-2@50544